MKQEEIDAQLKFLKKFDAKERYWSNAFKFADLSFANLEQRDLRWIDFRGANFFKTKLSYSDLRHTNLRGANFFQTELAGTVLCPRLIPNGRADEFQRDGKYVIGYRTEIAGNHKGPYYKPGRFYSADVFSVCEETTKHPGIYLEPTTDLLRTWGMKEGGIVKVRTKPETIHNVNGQYRCQWLEVLDYVPLTKAML